jgi:hypothetical protein
LAGVKSAILAILVGRAAAQDIELSGERRDGGRSGGEEGGMDGKKGALEGV